MSPTDAVAQKPGSHRSTECPSSASSRTTSIKPRDDATDDAASESSDGSMQAGIRAIEAISQTWSPWALTVAYVGIFLVATSTSLEGQTTTNLTTYAASAFGQQTLISTVSVVGSIMLAVVKAPMAKVADVFGRLEAFCLSIFLFILGYIQQASSGNIATFAAAQVFYSSGSTGLQILIQIFVADTTNLLNRSLIATLPDIPFLFTTWLGPVIAGSLVPNQWRWGYGLWAIILPAAFLPFFISLGLNQHRARRAGLLPTSPFKGRTTLSVAKELWLSLDIFGVLLFVAAVCLILLPLTLAPKAEGGFGNPSMIAMLVIGTVALVVFPLWERSKKFAPHAFFPPDLFRKPSVIVGVLISFFYFMAYYLSVYPYFGTYLQIVTGLSAVAAGHITQTFAFTATITAVNVGLLIKYTGHVKYFITIGASIYLLGILLMFKYRSPDTTVASLVACQIAIGIGGGMLHGPAQLVVQASARHTEVAAVTAVWLTFLEIGGAVGNAISGAIWGSLVPKKLHAYLPHDSKHLAPLIFGDINVAKSFPPGSPVYAAVIRAYQETMFNLLIGAACAAAVVLPLTLLTENFKLRDMDQNVKSVIIGGPDSTTDPSEDSAEAAPLLVGAGAAMTAQGRNRLAKWPFRSFKGTVS